METDNPLISVIIPVYNAESYLNRCVEAVKAQTWQNLEIILVDDGSKDSSGSLCDELSLSDGRIRVIHKPNGGASSARNAGLEICTGEYITFADADDWPSPEMYETLYALLTEHEADMSAVGIIRVSEDGAREYWNPELNLLKEFTKEEALAELVEEKLLTFGLWNKLYKRSLIGGQKFREGIIYEDNEFLPRCIAKAEKVVFSGKPLYHHFLSPVSVMRGGYSLKHYALISVTRENIEFYLKECPSACNRLRARFLTFCLDAVYKSAGNVEWNEKRAELIEEIRKPIPRSVFSQVGVKDRVKLVLCRLSPDLYSKLMCRYKSVK